MPNDGGKTVFAASTIAGIITLLTAIALIIAGGILLERNQKVLDGGHITQEEFK